MKFPMLLLFAAWLAGGDNLSAQSTPMNLMTFNIRFNNPGDGDNRWDLRKAYVAETLRFLDVHVCGMQEALIGQIEDVLAHLPHYAYIGVGRDDGKAAGEFSPILYDTTRIKLLKSNTFWLSPTPEKVSKGWDAALPRIATWAKLEDRLSGQAFYVFNTHFDHVGTGARLESAKLIIRKVQELAGTETAFIMGDFNVRPAEEPVQLLQAAFTDCKTVSRTPHFGPDATFSGFGPKEVEGMRIDYIFCNNPDVTVLKHATISQTWAGRFASDHHAVLTVVSGE
ncbi:MAG: endonuclease/exonuclease/phosphatase family protein [Saprospiraceae bacterium]|nr:endonuclease/exonuclease/phosphatase family protein [Saprospiraceae bacterium]